MLEKRKRVRILLSAAESVIRQLRKKLMGAHVNDALSGFQDLSRDAVGKIGFANTGVAGNKKIAARMAVKGGDEPTAAAEDLSHVLPGRQSAVPFRPSE